MWDIMKTSFTLFNLEAQFLYIIPDLFQIPTLRWPNKIARGEEFHLDVHLFSFDISHMLLCINTQ